MDRTRLQRADALLARIASPQFGLFTRAQAFAAGHSAGSISLRLKQGRWMVVLPGVYGIVGSPSSWYQQMLGAVLWAGDGSAASFGAAARLWGFEGFGGAPVEISTVGRRRDVGMPFRCHRVDRFLVPEIQIVSGIPVTSVRRTVLDLAGIRHPRHERVLDQAVRIGQTSLGQMCLLYEEEWTRGRRGIAILRELLVHRVPDAAPSRSDLEKLFLGIVRDFSLPEPEREYPIMLPFDEIHADFCYPDSRLVIETDGYAFHSDRESFENDRERDAELQAIGWRTLRFTWGQLSWRRAWVADTVLRYIDSPTVLGPHRVVG